MAWREGAALKVTWNTFTTCEKKIYIYLVGWRKHCFSSVLSAACPPGTFKSTQGPGLCLQCPPNSRSTSEAATVCVCRNGYYRGDADQPDEPCTSELIPSCLSPCATVTFLLAFPQSHDPDDAEKNHLAARKQRTPVGMVWKQQIVIGCQPKINQQYWIRSRYKNIFCQEFSDLSGVKVSNITSDLVLQTFYCTGVQESCDEHEKTPQWQQSALALAML